ncbi:MAG: hypothetical protein KAX19_13365 [Candidatus Brocadiae bacterium]|nr:hypothetical protein [Candidatus Brocadiia bacterium]
MHLWLALLWFGYAVLALVVFVLCRKRVADIRNQVTEEIEHRTGRVLKAEREAEELLCQAFLGFQNSADAVGAYQQAQAEVDGAPRANPPWNWSHQDLDLLRKQALAEEGARRSRGPIVTSVVGILGVTVAAALATVILSDSVRPVVATPGASPASTAGFPAASLPPPVDLPTLPASAPGPVTRGEDLTPAPASNESDEEAAAGHATPSSTPRAYGRRKP